ncbi:MAG TPA: SsrA-binding protein, partial [Arenibacter sp.]|nr:SsrA-binding protein [Arenibacter sp.]
YNHKPKAERKLLLNRGELKKLEKEVKNSGLTIIPLNLFLNDRGLAKMNIALARGKKLFDKRETIKDRDNKKNLDRIKKSFNN